MTYAAVCYSELQNASQEIRKTFQNRNATISTLRKKIDYLRQVRSRIVPFEELDDESKNKTTVELIKASLNSHKEVEQLITAFLESLKGILEKKLTNYIEHNQTKIHPEISIGELIPHLDDETVQIYLDLNLPTAWDFKRDLFVTHKRNKKLQNLMKERGQERTLSLSKDQTDSEIFKEMLKYGYYPPRLTFYSGFKNEECNHQKETITTTVKSLNIYSNTFDKFSKIWVKHEIQNASTIGHSKCATSLESQFIGKDILIISPGPSLKNDIKELKKQIYKYVSIAPIQTFPALRDENIWPDFLICIDQEDFKNRLNLENIEKSKALIFVESCHPNIVDLNIANKFTIFTQKQTLNLHEAIKGKVLRLFGASVSVIATDLARELGAKTITLLGQDLIIDQDSTYFGLPKSYNKTEIKNDKIIWQGKKVELQFLEAKNGKNYPTRPDFFNFHFEFEYFATQIKDNLKLFNATSHGAKIKGFKDISFGCKEGIFETESNNKLIFPKKSKSNEQIFEILRNKLQKIENINNLSSSALNALKHKDIDLIKTLEKIEKSLLKVIKDEWLLNLYLKPFISIFIGQIQNAKTIELNLLLSETLYSEILSSTNELKSFIESALNKP